MTASEFKAWLNGFLEGRQHRPTVEDLNLIAKKAEELQDYVSPPQQIYSPFWIEPPWTPSPWYKTEIFCGESSDNFSYSTDHITTNSADWITVTAC